MRKIIVESVGESRDEHFAVQFLPQGFRCFLVRAAVVFGRHRDIGMACSPLGDPDVLWNLVAYKCAPKNGAWSSAW